MNSPLVNLLFYCLGTESSDLEVDPTGLQRDESRATGEHHDLDSLSTQHWPTAYIMFLYLNLLRLTESCFLFSCSFHSSAQTQRCFNKSVWTILFFNYWIYLLYFFYFKIICVKSNILIKLISWKKMLNKALMCLFLTQPNSCDISDSSPVNWGQFVQLGTKAVSSDDNKLIFGSAVKVKVWVRVCMFVVNLRPFPVTESLSGTVDLTGTEVRPNEAKRHLWRPG